MQVAYKAEKAPALRRGAWRILFEDNHVLVVEKGTGILSQADGSDRPCLPDLIKAYIKERDQKPGQVYLGLIHRLDFETSGLLIYAKTSKAAARLSDQMRRHQIDKRYLLIAEGASALEESGQMRDWLKKDPKTKSSSVVFQDTDGAKMAQLRYQRISEIQKDTALFWVRLQTGRSHQIRVQFSHRNAALLGDERYGKAKSLGELALHAAYLSFLHPVAAKPLAFCAFPTDERFSLFSHQISQLDINELEPASWEGKNYETLALS